ncbi:MAG: NUDIX domain-containing protein [Pseudomonadota bacterium]
MSREIKYRFCPECGARMSQQPDPGGGPPLMECSRCGLVIHLDPKVAVAGLLTRDGAVLLLKRAREPRKGFWCLPGGYVDRGETLEAGLTREVIEETGFSVEVKDLIGLYSYPDYPVVVAIYKAAILGGNLPPGPELLEARWFKPDELPWEDLAFASTKEALASWAGFNPAGETQPPAD